MSARAKTIGGRGAAALLFSACATLAQNEPTRPSFEVASVKPVEQGRPGIGPLRGGPGTNSPGQLSGAASLKALLMRAYELKSYQIAGPAWMDSERYEIVAKIPAGASKGLVSAMLQSLLAERFHLMAHRETKDLPIYAMVAGKSGPKLKQSPAADQNATGATADDGTVARRAVPKIIRGPDGFPDIAAGTDIPRSYEVVVGGSDGILYKLWARRETMSQLADRLSSQLNRAVVDMTALKEQYDFTLSWTMENARGGVPRTDPPPDEIDFHSTPVMSDPGLSIFTAVQTQLGLKLEQRRGPLETLIVDRVEKAPTGN
jgi:uncharacterized protein (TIGR03435 family)